MDNKYIALILILGIIVGYILCTLINNKHIIKDVAITNPASW